MNRRHKLVGAIVVLMSVAFGVAIFLRSVNSRMGLPPVSDIESTTVTVYSVDKDSLWRTVDQNVIVLLHQTLSENRLRSSEYPPPECPQAARLDFGMISGEVASYGIVHVHDQRYVAVEPVAGAHTLILNDGPAFLEALSAMGVDTSLLFVGEESR